MGYSTFIIEHSSVTLWDAGGSNCSAYLILQPQRAQCHGPAPVAGAIRLFPDSGRTFGAVPERLESGYMPLAKRGSVEVERCLAGLHLRP